MKQETLTLQEAKELAEITWHGKNIYNENEKMLWINGFVMGVLTLQIKHMDKMIEEIKKEKI
jgi:spore coat protein CotF